MWNADTLGYRGNTDYNKAYEGDELVWEKQVGPPNDEIWYTSRGGVAKPFDATVLPTIVSNTYVNGKGVIKFATDVTKIGKEAFRYNHELTSFIMPNSVTILNTRAFFYSIYLSSVILSNNLTYIGSEAFNNCPLKSIKIPNGVTTIGSSAFLGCTRLTSISYTGTMSQWNAISKGSSWHKNVPATVVHCTDGDTPI